MSPESSHEDHDALADRRADQGVWNGAMGKAALDGFYPDQSTKRSKAKTSELKTHKPRHTGRSSVEPSGSDVSRDEANFDALQNHMSEEDKAKNLRGMGHALFLYEKGLLEHAALIKRADGDPVRLAVETQILADGKK